MKAFHRVMQAVWADMTAYRLNFLLWRVRIVMQRLVVYFLWWALFTNRDMLFGYTEHSILTYVLLVNIVATFTLATQTMEIGNVINQGDLSYLLLRPMNFFRYYLARDAADKLLNAGFAVVEITLFILLLRPPLFVQTNPIFLLASIAGIGIGAGIYFYFSVLLGLLGFWTADVWSVRFLSFVIMDFFSGGLFPLDILPGTARAVVEHLPFAYFIYFPIKVYLGQLSGAAIGVDFAIGLAWVALFMFITSKVWMWGLRVYTAEGR